MYIKILTQSGISIFFIFLHYISLRAVLLGSLTVLLSTQVPFPNKISCFVSTCASSDNSFPSVRQEPSFGPWKGSLFLQQMATLAGTLLH